MGKRTRQTPFRLLRTKRNDSKSVAAGVRTGAAWYSEADWRRVREIAADPEWLEATYDDWCRMFERSLEELAQHGLAVERVAVRADELESWCQQRNRVIDAAARSEFACELLARTRS
jgi:hypothetical protein